MKISVRVKPNARRNEVKQVDENNYLVCVAAPPVEGKANRMVIEALSAYFGKPKRCIDIVSGFKGKIKIVKIL